MMQFKNQKHKTRSIAFLIVFIMVLSIVFPMINLVKAREFENFSIDSCPNLVDINQDFDVGVSFNFEKNSSEPDVNISISLKILETDEKINNNFETTLSINDTYNYVFSDCLIEESDVNGSGFYNVSAVLFYTDNNTEICNETHKLYVNEPPTCTIQADTTSGFGPLKVEFTLNAYDSEGISTFELDFDDGETYSNPSNFSFPYVINHTYSSFSSFTAILTVTDTNGSSTSDDISINVKNPAPTASFTYSPDSPDEGQEVDFDASGSSAISGRTIEEYKWDFDDDGNYDDGNIESESYTWNIPGNKIVRLQVTDSEGDKDTYSETIDIISTNQKPVADAGGPYVSYMDTNISFDGAGSSDPDGDSLTYSWDFGNGTIKTGEEVVHKYNEIGVYEISLTVTDPEGFKDTDETNVTIENQAPEKPLIEGLEDLEKDEEYDFEFTSTDNEGHDVKIVVDWDDGSTFESDFVLSGETVEMSHTWDESGRYLISAYSDDNLSESSSRSFEVFVDSLEVSSIGYLIDTDSDDTYDEFYNYSSGGKTTLKMENGRYIIDSNANGVGDYTFDPINEILEEVIINPKKDPKDFNQKISSSASLNLGSGISVSVDYSLDAKMKIIGQNCMPGESCEVEVTLKNGMITVDANVDILTFSESGTASTSLSLGESKEIPISGGVIKIPVSVNANLKNIEGSYNVEVDESNIKFDKEGTKTFKVTVSDDSEIGDSFDVFSDVELNLNVGMIIDAVVHKQTITEQSMPMGRMDPPMEVTGRVDEPNNAFLSLSLSNPIIWIAIIVIVAAVAAYLVKKYVLDKKSKKTPSPDAFVKDVGDLGDDEFIRGGDTPDLDSFSGGSIAPNVNMADAASEDSSYVEVDNIDDLNPLKSNEEVKNIEEEFDANFCPECGAPVKGKGNFCTQCGNKIKQ